MVGQSLTSDFEVWENGSSNGTDTSGNWGVTGQVQNIQLAAAYGGGTATLFGDTQIYGMIWFNRSLTDDERSVIRTDLGKKSGVTVA